LEANKLKLIFYNSLYSGHKAFSLLVYVFCLFICFGVTVLSEPGPPHSQGFYEGWNFNSGNYLFTTDRK